MIKNKCSWNKRSELEWGFSIKLSVEVSLLFVQKLWCVILGLFHRVSEGFAENVIGHNSPCEASVTRNGVVQFHVLLSIFEDCLWVSELICFLFCYFLLKRLRLWQGELINVVSSYVKIGRWLHNDFLVRNTDDICCCSLKH